MKQADEKSRCLNGEPGQWEPDVMNEQAREGGLTAGLETVLPGCAVKPQASLVEEYSF